jgi:hypothetical protein
MIRSFFAVMPSDLEQLGPELAVSVLREMLWAEVHNVGIPFSQTDIPFPVTTPDGGIDAVVNGTPKGAGAGLIFAPRTAYQVKAGDFPLNATSLRRIEEILIAPSAISARRGAKDTLRRKTYTPEEISPRVRACLDVGGTFVTMLFGNDGIDTEEEATEDAMRAFLGTIDSRYAKAQIKVWRQSRICGLLQAFPAVSLQIKNQDGLQLLSHSQWSDRHDLTQDFFAAPEQQQVIDALREALRDDSRGSIHVRVIGEPGIGKTRLILETLRADDLKPIALYADKGTKIDGSVVSAIRNAKGARMILVVDECGPEVRSELVRNFATRGAQLKVISIYQDRDDADEASDYRLFGMPPLPATEIRTILHTYDVESATTAAWATLCEGSPRVAHVIGQNLRQHPGDPLRSDGVAQIWVRFLAGDVGRETEEYRIRHLIISSLSLFKKFGWSPQVRAGAFEVYNLIISKLDAGISIDRFVGVVEHMAARKVLQGDNFLYITPRALHIKLWTDWWNRHRASINVNDLIPKLTPLMRQWFGEMFEYAEATQISKRLVEQLLGPDGLYKDAEWLNTKEGGRFFFSLSLASPPNALRLLERTIGRTDRDGLLKFEEGRRDVIWALEGLALHSDLFTSSAKLLLSLAEAENETWTNNATGVFAGLFSLGHGEVAPTSLAPEHRLPVLNAALRHKDRRSQIALGAFETALAIQHISRMGSDQPFRLRKQVTRWTPKTYGELFAAYRLYWRTLRDSLEFLPASQRERGVEILLSRTRELLQVEALRGEILDTLQELAGFPDADKREIISTIETILRYDSEGMPSEVASQLTALRDQMIGVTFHSRMQRYAGMDLLEDQIDKAGNQTDRTASDIRKLAEEALAAPDILIPELRWLVTREAKNGYRFGYALAQKDEELSSWEKIRDAYFSAGDEADGYFVGGYLRAVFEHDPKIWEAIIASIAAEGPNLPALPGLIWRSGMTEGAAELILQLVRSDKLPPETLGVFKMGRGTDGLSDAMLGEWLDVLIGVGSLSATSTALDLASMSILGGRVLSAAQLEKILTLPPLSARKVGRADSMLSHHWLQLSRKLIKLDPKAESTVLATLLQSIAESGPITASLGPEGDKYLDALVSRHPRLTWRTVSDYVKPPMDVRGFVVTRWLRGDMGFSGRSPGPMRHLPREEIWSWIEADPERRASYVANMAPKDFTVEDWGGSLIRGILCRFGDSDKVQSSVFANFFTGGWTGPASSHYETQRQVLTELKSGETNPHALRWLNTAIESTEKSLKSAEIEEEARDTD